MFYELKWAVVFTPDLVFTFILIDLEELRFKLNARINIYGSIKAPTWCSAGIFFY